MNGNVGCQAWGCERKEKRKKKKEKRKKKKEKRKKKKEKRKKKKRFTYADGRDGVRADPLCVVKDAVYSWLLMRMDGGGVGCRAWECEKKKEKEKCYLRGWVAVDACGW